jgi:sulfur carrier protein
MNLRATTCRVLVNGEACDIEPGTTLEALLDRLGFAPPSVATAIDGQFVPRHQRASRVLREGDRITCFQPIVGG